MWSLFEPAERRLARHETDSEWTRYLPEAEFPVGQPGSLVAMKQRRETVKCLEGLEPPREIDLPLLKNPAHQQERQLPLAL